MCGIFGYVGTKCAVKLSIAGLKKLEYRGYDSSGIAGLNGGNTIKMCKRVGKVAVMEEAAKEMEWNLNVAIAHTRWATHGKPTEYNAHPHLDSEDQIALVHNGIIENYDSLREQLQAEGVKFRSDTDTEVMVQLIAKNYDGDIRRTVQRVMPQLKGALAIALVHVNHPGQIICAAKESPLAIGIGNKEVFISSDTNAFLVHTKEVVYLHDSEVAVVTEEGFEVFDVTMSQVLKERELLESENQEVSKGDFEHFMLKEIYEQPQTIRNALLARYLEKYGTVTLEGLNIGVNDLLSIERILILACGSSWHAGYVASYMIEEHARIPVQVEISSEFRYKNPIVADNTLVIAISQSGETADTVAAMRELKEKGAKVVTVCNVQGSTLAREADGCLLLRAGAEIGVASTKAFVSQLTVLTLFTVLMARMRHMSKSEGQGFISDLKNLPDQIKRVLAQQEHIAAIAKKYAQYDNYFFVGRGYMFPVSLEGALKLKEISYINANGYPAGELKHGPIALIDESCPTVGLCTNSMTIDKTISNLMEVKARNGAVIAVVFEGDERLVREVADDIISVPRVRDELAAIGVTVALQLLAYFVAHERGCEIDQPRNLAKSVTVE